MSTSPKIILIWCGLTLCYLRIAFLYVFDQTLVNILDGNTRTRQLPTTSKVLAGVFNVIASPLSLYPLHPPFLSLINFENCIHNMCPPFDWIHMFKKGVIDDLEHDRNRNRCNHLSIHLRWLYCLSEFGGLSQFHQSEYRHRELGYLAQHLIIFLSN